MTPSSSTALSRQTLQLRHQLTCAGVTLQSAAYDTTRHHMLSYDSCALAPHTLRLFSLRRELKSTRLFDDANPPPPPVSSTLSKQSSTRQLSKRNANHQSKDESKNVTVPVVVSLSLEYSATSDVFICVYSAQSVVAARAKSKRTTLDGRAVYNVLFLEPATLKKLVHYPGPASHRLQCVHFDSGTDRVVLAVHRRQSGSASGSSSPVSNVSGVYVPSNQRLRRELQDDDASLEHGGDEDDEVSDTDPRSEPAHGPMHNHIDTLQIYKREFRATAREGESRDEVVEQRRVMLCVEKVGPSLLHAETVDLLCCADRLTRIFGVGRVSPAWRAEGDSFLIEWRESAEQKLEMIRRVVVHDAVSAITVSPCSKWLYAGHESGAVRVWNICQLPSGSKKRPRSYTLGSSPLEAATAGWHGSPISSVQVFSAPESSDPHRDIRYESHQSTAMEAMIVTTDRDSGVVKHWRFRAETERTAFADGDVVATIDLVGVYNCDADASERQRRSTHTHTNKKTLLKSISTTVPLCVHIDMGGFAERLLLVLRADVIHVLKVQAVVRVVQHTSHGDAISAVRVAGNRLVVLSGDLYSCLRVLDLDSGSAKQLNCVAPPATQRSAKISAIDCFSTGSDRAFVALGWNTGGVVEVRSLDTNARVLTLQDPQLNAWVTAVSVVLQAIEQMNPLGTAPTGAALEGVQPTTGRSWGGLLRSTATTAATAKTNSLEAAAQQATRNSSAEHRILSASLAFVFAGTECGRVFGWKLPTDFDDESSGGSERLVLEAKLRVDNAHSAHVVQLVALPARAGHAARVASLGADGMVKVWAVPSMTLLGYANIATERHMSIPSCMTFVRSEREQSELYLAVGFEDGVLAAWRVDQRRMSFAEMPVSSQHERRVTRISPLARSSECGADFVTSSLDMTAILWTITDGGVEERRYFDIGAPVVDVCTLGNEAFVGLSNEICAFEYCRRRDDSSVEATSLELLKADGDRTAPEYDDDKFDGVKTAEPTSNADVFLLESLVGAESVDAADASERNLLEPLSSAAQLSQRPAPDSAQSTDALPVAGSFVTVNGRDVPVSSRTTTLHFEIGAPVVDVGASERLSSEEADEGGSFKDSAPIHTTGSRAGTGAATIDGNSVKHLLPDAMGDKQVHTSTVSKSRKHRKLSVAESIGPKVRDELPDDSLVRRLQLSRCFQRHWSRGFCWCGPGSELRVSWTEPSGDELHPTCADCHMRVHTLALKKTGYKPHFSLRAVLGIIADVYRALLAPSHTLLFKNASRSSPQSPSGVSLHSALFRVFTAMFGMQSVVEEKLKLFLVSATHYVRDFDAVAVFSELLATLSDDGTSADEQVPDEMVALCVCCYSWFFSRAMVTNGDQFIGRGHGKGPYVVGPQQESSADIEKGKRTCWQFVRLDSALVCAQEMLLYPLVSPGYLRSILMYTGEYVQATPSRPTTAGDDADSTNESSSTGAKWIEIHRFLRLLIGEWKQQNREFRLAEQTLFVQPLVGSSTSSDVVEQRAGVVEKLRLILSCFIFYDHSREGAITLPDFAGILQKLQYLWLNEDVTEEGATSDRGDQLSLTFENTVLAAKRRFADLDGDGQLCYLDFWAMLYVVGIRTLSLLKFREIPSFCKDYKLEIAPDLRDLLQSYMARSSTTMLPRGFQLGKSSLDQRAAAQHLQRVQGLHDGLFTMPIGLSSSSLSMQELIRMGSERVDPKDQIYLEGTAPVLSESASVTAMERFRPVTHDSSDMCGVPPVVVGVRQSGPRAKQQAVLSVSAMATDALPMRGGDKFRPLQPPQELRRDAPPCESRTGAASKDSASAFSSTYVQFPFVRPRRRRVERSAGAVTGTKERHVGARAHRAVTAASHRELDWTAMIIQEHEEDELASQQVVLPGRPSVTTNQLSRSQPVRYDSLKESKTVAHMLAQGDSLQQQRSKKNVLATATSAASLPPDADQPAALVSSSELSAPAPAASEPRPSNKRKKSTTTVVVIPNVEKEPTQLRVLSPESVSTVSAPLAKRPDPPHEHPQVPDAKSLPVQQPAAVVEMISVAATLPDTGKRDSVEEATSEAFTIERWTTRARDVVDEPQPVEPAEPPTRSPPIQAGAQAPTTIASTSFSAPAHSAVTSLQELPGALLDDKQSVAAADAHDAEHDESGRSATESTGASIVVNEDESHEVRDTGKGSDHDVVMANVEPDLGEVHHETSP
ncbi:hypothetical protein PybrP1_004274 [[Pythium] brassicae (nom. inval.)]|nr:hypothetical protein PybrP1_004274 [[Pythium] brassicae (nom. inval.)]